MVEVLTHWGPGSSKPLPERRVNPVIHSHVQSVSHCTTEVKQSHSHPFTQPSSHIVNQSIIPPLKSSNQGVIRSNSHHLSWSVNHSLHHKNHPIKESFIHQVIQSHGKSINQSLQHLSHPVEESFHPVTR